LSIIDNLSEYWSQYLDCFDAKDSLQKMDLSRLTSKIKTSTISALDDLLELRRLKGECYKMGLSDFINKFELSGIDPSQLENVFLRCFYYCWLDKVMKDSPAVQAFRRVAHEESIREFSQLDEQMFRRIARNRLKARLIGNLPDLTKITGVSDELSILQRELTKQRKIMPIRILFREIPNLLPRLKPCLMMSPLSVSLFLSSNCYHFDIVIFDEASQVRTEDAIGAIIRGTQVIIAGDSQQLPPTNFFSACTSDSDYDDDDESDDSKIYNTPDAYDSVLE